MDTNIASIPEDLRKRYLDRRSKDVEDCFTKLQLMDWSYFERLGHQLKGNAPSYGYDDLGDIAYQMETSAQQKDMTKLETCLMAFRHWLDRHRC